MAEMLYEDKQLKVQFDPKIEGHWLQIKDTSYFIPRGILQEAARTRREELEDKLNNLNPQILFAARWVGLSVDAIGYALSQARVEELEKELSASYRR
jgi:hypothetical protein